MSVRKVRRRDPKNGELREFWIVDVLIEKRMGPCRKDPNKLVDQSVRDRKVVKSRREGEAYERQVRLALANGTWRSKDEKAAEAKAAKEKEVPTFERFVDDRWLPSYPSSSRRASTVRVRKDHCRLYLVPALGTKRLNEIKNEVIQRLLSDLSQKGLSAKTIHGVRGTLRLILDTAVKWEVLVKLPEFPKVKLSKPKWDYYNREESAKLLAAARTPAERTLLMFALHSGARAGEQLALTWGDLDWHTGKVVFRNTLSGGVLGPTKTGEVRRVPMTAELKAALRAHKHLRGDHVFCNEDGTPMSIWQLHERLEAVSKRAGLRRVRWHDLRHSFASQLVIAGVPLRQVQEWLGHTTIVMTEKYSHLSESGNEMIAVLQSDHLGGNPAAIRSVVTAN